MKPLRLFSIVVSLLVLALSLALFATFKALDKVDESYASENERLSRTLEAASEANRFLLALHFDNPEGLVQDFNHLLASSVSKKDKSRLIGVYFIHESHCNNKTGDNYRNLEKVLSRVDKIDKDVWVKSVGYFVIHNESKISVRQLSEFQSELEKSGAPTESLKILKQAINRKSINGGMDFKVLDYANEENRYLLQAHVNGFFIRGDVTGLSDFRRNFIRGDYRNLSLPEKIVCAVEYVLYTSENKVDKLEAEWSQRGMPEETLSGILEIARGGRTDIK